MGILSGWEGITYLDRERGRDALIFREDDTRTWSGGYLMPLERLNTHTIDRSGGTILHSTRTNPANVRVADLPPNLQRYAEGRGPNERVDLTIDSYSMRYRPRFEHIKGSYRSARNQGPA